ncbi:hypothetical protein RRG08_054694 [Elysia crispata]|uniref:Uncharacterized protein n=1 Tax=Elysia crispata TaxID=231223 RepID=A0AAE1B1M3_9GAST|nr:hypothetical protein RRG08_054694 [Elysia crispata]
MHRLDRAKEYLYSCRLHRGDVTVQTFTCLPEVVPVQERSIFPRTETKSTFMQFTQRGHMVKKLLIVTPLDPEKMMQTSASVRILKRFEQKKST